MKCFNFNVMFYSKTDELIGEETMSALGDTIDEAMDNMFGIVEDALQDYDAAYTNVTAI